MSGTGRGRLPAWAAGVFALALAARLGFLFLVDQPLLFTHQYTYFSSALKIAEHPHPLAYILTSDEWRTWDNRWTIAPLYHLFAAAVLWAFGPHLLPLQLLQCVLDALAAVGVAALGRQVAGPRGALAGAVYALHWPAVEMPSWTMTENVHTVLFVAGICMLAREGEKRSRLVAGGLLLGLSALARSVSTGFLALTALLRLRAEGLRRGWLPAALIAAGGAAAVLPWTARNVFLMGDLVPIESAAYENIWWANHFGDPDQYRRQHSIIYGPLSPAAAREAALRFALRGIRRHPDLFAAKVWANFRHFLRPDWLDSLLRVERPGPAWQYAAGIVSEDLVLVVAVPLFVVFLLAGRPSPARGLIALWTAYYLFMIVVVFHNELRYRSALTPFALAGAAGGLSVLADPEARRRARTRLALALGLWMCVLMLGRHVLPAGRAIAAAWALRPAPGALARGDVAEAERIAAAASARDPLSPRPWLVYGRELALTGHTAEAIEAYSRARKTPAPVNWIPALVLPRLLQEAGRADESAQVLREADALSWSTDPWLVLETAWQETPPPRTDEIVMGRGDYGAVRGFLHPRGIDPELAGRYVVWNQYGPPGPNPPPGAHRWSRHRAWLRLVPTRPAPAYLVTLEMGSPFPSPLASPEVRVRAGDGEPVRFSLGREVRPYTLRAAERPGDALVVRLDAPTWCRPGEPAEQGVRVDRMTVAPAP